MKYTPIEIIALFGLMTGAVTLFFWSVYTGLSFIFWDFSFFFSNDMFMFAVRLWLIMLLVSFISTALIILDKWLIKQSEEK